MKPFTCAFATLSSAMALCATAPAFAQAAVPDREERSSQPADDTLQQDIIVTATKRAENVQRVPLTVSVVGPSTIQSLNIVNTADLTRAVPGLTFTSSVSVALAVFDIRGVGTYATGAASSNLSEWRWTVCPSAGRPEALPTWWTSPMSRC